MRAFGCDPGKSAAWAIVELLRPLSRARLIACGILDRGIAEGRDQRAAEAVEHCLRYEAEACGVECVEFVVACDGFGPNFAGHLVRAARIGGKVYQALEDHGFPVEEVEAEVWRRALTRKAQADDDEVLAAVKARVAGVPDGITNHETDGIGVAILTAERALLAAAGHQLPPAKRRLNSAPKKKRAGGPRR